MVDRLAEWGLVYSYENKRLCCGTKAILRADSVSYFFDKANNEDYVGRHIKDGSYKRLLNKELCGW